MKLNKKLAFFFFTSLFSATLLMTQVTRVSAPPRRAPERTWDS